MRLSLLATLPFFIVSACSTEPSGSRDTGGTSGPDTGFVIDQPNDAGHDAGPRVPVDAAGYQGPSIVYGESSDTLYQLNPDTKAASAIGPFVGCTGVIDLALDKDSLIFATTFSGMYTINPANAHCTLVATGNSYPNSLSFVPAGTVDPLVEALVGYHGSDYVRIDTKTGAISTIGHLTGGYTSSGDIVSVKDGGTYLTVKGAGCDQSDCLFEIDPATGDRKQNLGTLTGYTDVFGLAFWAGKLYGFTNAGQLFEINLKGGLSTTPIQVPNAPAGLSFWGAGSTTSAPIGPN
jgi:hypothetical protein